MKLKGLFLSVSLVLLLVLTTVDVQARCGYYYNPLLLPFAVAGAVVGTVAAITTAVVPGSYYPAPVYTGPVYSEPVYAGPTYYVPAPGYYGPGPRPHYFRPGYYRPEPRPHYFRPGWTPEHHNGFGHWAPGHRR